MTVSKLTNNVKPLDEVDKINEIIDELDNANVAIDNSTITKNTSDQLQTVGVIDSNNTTNAIKTWTGTKAQYDAIVTKDANTLYFCTDSGEIYLGSVLISNKTNGKDVGDVVLSLTPKTDAGLHLLDGALINGSGIYADFVTYIANLYNSTPGVWKNQSNIVPTSISSTNTQGFTVSATAGGSEVHLSLNPTLNIDYPRWQFSTHASTTPQSMTILFPEVRSIDYYTITQWCDGSNTGRIVTAWTLEYTTDGGSTWTTCDTRSDIPQTKGYTGTYTLSTPIYDVNGIRITATGGGSGGYSSIGQIRFYGKEKFLGAPFDTETNWQSSVSTYGVCGKFVYDATANTVRLPKYSNKIYTQELDSTAPVIGNGMTLGLTNGATNYGLSVNNNSSSPFLYGATGSYGLNVGSTKSGSANTANLVYGVTTDPTKSGILAQLSDITTSLDGYYYIVIATSTKTDIEVDIDEVVTDLNGKADTDLTNCTDVANIKMAHNAMPSDTYTNLTLGASGTTYTAPANGYILFQRLTTAAGQFIALTGRDSSNNALVAIRQYSQASGNYLTISIPVRKGSTYQANYTAAGTSGNFFRFIYAKGSESEAS